MNRHYRRCNCNDDGMGCLIMVLLGIFALPLVGLYMMLAGDNGEQRTIGVVLLIVGVIIWIATGAL